MIRNFSQYFVFCFWTSCIYMLSKNGVNAVGTNGNESTTQGQSSGTQFPINLQSLSAEEKKKFKDSFDTIFSDCDGVLYDGNGIINNANEAANKLVKQGKTIRYITNNCVRTRAKVAQKLINLGFPKVTEDLIVCPLGLLVEHFQKHLPPGKSVYVIGPQVICDELLNQNIECFGPGKDEMSDEFRESIFTTAEIEVPEAVGAVVVGYDVDFNYLKILKAIRYLNAKKDCLYVVMSPEETFPSRNGGIFPATGALATSITAASGRTPYILGKPSAYVVEMLKSMVKDPQRALFIGDNLKIDIVTGHKCTFRTIFVLSGMLNTLDDVKRYAQSKDAEEKLYVPHYYTSSFSDLALE